MADVVDYIGDKFLPFLIKPKVNSKGAFEHLPDVINISKHTFERYRQRETESFFIIGQEIGPKQYVWYWELMPDVISFKQKIGKSLHSSFKEYVKTKFSRDGNIYVFIAHVNHPNYIACRYVVPNLEYFDRHVELIRTFKMDFMGTTGKMLAVPVGKDFNMIKIAIKDVYRGIIMYYNILKYSVDIGTI